ncbi:MAG: hypothetical protein HYZ87_02635 [Candidatus Omnitrophica bacterium]|nr:hypothetical protein [Candidatus Omnitrophota bacterium]
MKARKRFKEICYTSRMKFRRRVSTKIVWTLAFFAALFSVYLYLGLFPGKLKAKVIQKIEGLTEARVEFSKSLYLPFEGLIFHDLKVMDSGGRTLFSAKKLSLNARLIPFFKEKKIIVDRVSLESPVYEWPLEPAPRKQATLPPKTVLSGQIPVPVVPDDPKPDISALEEGPNALLPENVYLQSIEISDGHVLIRKNSASPVLEHLRAINLRLEFEKPPVLTLKGFFHLGETAYASINFQGQWDLEKAGYEFLVEIKADEVPPWLDSYQQKAQVHLERGRTWLEVRLQSVGEEKAFFRAQAVLQDALIHLHKIKYSGHMKLSAKGLFNFETKIFERYQGLLEFIDVSVDGLSEKLPPLHSIQGKIAFQPDLFTIQSVRGELNRLTFEVEGTIRSFKELLADAKIRTQATIEDVLELLPEKEKEFLRSFDVQGQCQALTLIRGTLLKPTELAKEFRLAIRDGSIRSKDKKIALEGLSAEIFADDRGARISDASFLMDEKKHLLNLTIPKKPLEPGKLRLSSPELRVEADYHLEGQDIRIRSADVSYLDGFRAQVQGKILNPTNPALDIQGDLAIDTAKASASLVRQVPALEKLDLRGTLNGYFALQGLWSDPLNWDFKMDGRGDPIFLKEKIQLDNFELQIRMKNKIVRFPYLHARIYGGTVASELWLDYSKPKPSFSGKMYLNQVDLGGIVKALKPSLVDFGGVITTQSQAFGELNDPQSIQGTGAVEIRDGRLWKTDLFKAMGDLPFVKVRGLDFVVFRQLTADFLIRDKRVWSENLHLFSDTVALTLKGSAGFDQTLDLMMNIRFSKDVLLGAMDTGGIAPFVVQEVEDFISQYKITGTLKEPKYEKVPLAMGRVIGKKLSGFLQNLASS